MRYIVRNCEECLTLHNTLCALKNIIGIVLSDYEMTSLYKVRKLHNPQKLCKYNNFSKLGKLEAKQFFSSEAT